jgi:hypothetical protein
MKGGRDKFTAMKVPRQCPLVVLVNVDWRGGKVFGSGEGREIKRGARRNLFEYLKIQSVPQRKHITKTNQ